MIKTYEPTEVSVLSHPQPQPDTKYNVVDPVSQTRTTLFGRISLRGGTSIRDSLHAAME